MSRELNEFRDGLMEVINRSRDYDDLSYFLEEFMEYFSFGWYAATEAQLAQVQTKIRGAVRQCNNLNLKRGYKGAAKDLADFIRSIVKKKV